MQAENTAVNKITFASLGGGGGNWRPWGDRRDFNCRNLITWGPAASALSLNSFTVCCRPMTLSHINLCMQPCASRPETQTSLGTYLGFTIKFIVSFLFRLFFLKKKKLTSKIGRVSNSATVNIKRTLNGIQKKGKRGNAWLHLVIMNYYLKIVSLIIWMQFKD